jgi:hypothetical protein
MKKAALVLILMTAALSAQQPQKAPPANPNPPVNPTPSQDQKQQYLEMQLQRDQVAVNSLEDTLMRLTEYRQLMQLQAEIQHLNEQLGQMKGPPAQAPAPPPPSQQLPANKPPRK